MDKHFDMLVRLYDIENDWSFIKQQESKGVVIRKPLGSEKRFIVNWVSKATNEYWASEVDAACSNNPGSCYMAIKDGVMVGFACYDATALGFFGPTAVAEPCRGQGTGKALLLACLLDMKLKGYGYAIIGAVGPAEFYANAVKATPIEGSERSVFGGVLNYALND